MSLGCSRVLAYVFYIIFQLHQTAGCRLILLPDPGHVPGLLSNPSGVGIPRATSEVNSTSTEFDEEERIDCSQHDRFDGEEITGEHLVFVVIEKRAPGRITSNWSRRDTMSAKYGADRGLRYDIAQFEQFTFDLAIATARILSSDSHDELFDL